MAAPLKLPPIPDPGPDSNSQFQTLLALKHTVDRIVLELTGASTAGVIDKAVNPTDITNSTTVGRSVITALDASAARGALGLGSASILDVGVSANNVVQLDGSAKIPAVDGSLLTNVDAAKLGGTAAASYAKKSDVPVLLATITGAGVSELAKTDCFSSDYSFYEVVLENIRGSVNAATLYMRWYSGGAYQTANYTAKTDIHNPGGAAGHHNTTFVDLTGGGRMVNSSTWGGVCGVLQFMNPAQTAYAPNMIGRTSFADASYGPYASWTHISAMRTVTGAVTGFQIYPSSGTITGTVKVYGRP